MNWSWLTSPSGVPLLIAVVGLGGTLVGVAATVVTQLLITRKTTAQADVRLKWEREKWREEQAATTTSRFDVVKREAFVRFIAQIDTLYGRKNLSFAFPILEAFTYKTYRDQIYELSESTIQISLVAQEIAPEAEALRRHVLPSGMLRSKNRDLWLDQYVVLRKSLLRVMRKSLNIENSRAASHTQPQLNKAPMRGTSEQQLKS